MVKLFTAYFVVVFSITSQATEIQNQQASAAPPKLASIIINNSNIFSNPERPLYKLINRTHWVTRKQVIRREIWLQPGDSVVDSDIQELERKLRDLGLFSHVEVTTRAIQSKTDTVNLIINTEDKLSFLGVAGATFLGGIGEIGFVLNENNVLGLGHQVQYKYVENTQGRTSGTLKYTNVLVSGNDTYAGVELGRTETGESLKLDLENRFHSFNDPQSWKIKLKRESTQQEYFEEGESIAQVPRTDKEFSLSRTIRRGTSESSWRFGPVFRFEKTGYRDARGSQADTLTVPEDNERTFAGVLFGRDRTSEYRKVTGIDTLGFTQDLSLGYKFDWLFGLSHNNTTSNESTLPVVFFNASRNSAVSINNYLNFGMESSLTVDEDSLEAWNLTTGVTWFNTRFDRQTIAAKLKYTSSYKRTGLPAQQSLGEDNGLRGYPTKEFNGEQLLLLNLEHRFKTALDFANFEIGTVAFLDAGWVGDRNTSTWLDSSQTSTGFGIRIGSPPLLGSAIIRLDYSYPLNDFNNNQYKPTVSFAVGQVFGFNP